MIVLFDFDSFIYRNAYRIFSLSEIKEFFKMGKSRETITEHIVDSIIDRTEQAYYKLFIEIEETGIEIEGVEYYVTTCKKSARKEKYPDYKANRDKTVNTMNKWVSRVRKKMLATGFASNDDHWEADDLIYDRAHEMGSNYIILTMDKDLKQIPGLFYDFYMVKELNEETGERDAVGYRGLSFVSKEQSEYNFWKQMLVGDRTDNIQGVKGIGDKKADKILFESEDYEQTVKDIYLEKHTIEDYEKAYYLIKLGTKR